MFITAKRSIPRLLATATVTAALLLTNAALLVGCSSDGTDTGTSTSSAAAAADASSAAADAAAANSAASATDTLPPDEVPPDPPADAISSYGPDEGSEFSVLVRDIIGIGYVEEFDAESLNGDSLNDAIFERNTAVTERLGIAFDVKRAKNSEYVERVQASVLAGDNAYDLLLPSAAQAYTLASVGATLDMNDIPGIERDKAWWSDELSEDSSIAGRDIFLGGDINLQIYNSLQVLIFNKGLAESYNIPDLYATVLEGRWTYDEMIATAKRVSGDVNGDGVMDKNDLYGLSNVSSSAVIFPYGSGLYLVVKDENDLPHVEFGEKFISFFMRMVEELSDSDWSLYADRPEYTSERMTLASELLFDDRLLMFRTDLGAAAQYRDRETDYGFLPIPKYDETQSDYISVVHPSIMSVVQLPITNDAVAESGIILEQLAYESWRSVRPIYIDSVMKQKYVRDAESVEVLDRILGNYGLDLAFAFSDTGLSIVGDLRSLLNSFDTNITSMLEKNLDGYRAKLDSIVEGLVD